jgi:hypothetical protein
MSPPLSAPLHRRADGDRGGGSKYITLALISFTSNFRHMRVV